MQNIHSNLHALSGASDPLEEIAQKTLDCLKKNVPNEETFTNDSKKEEPLSKDGSTEKKEATNKETNKKIISPSSEDKK